MSDSNAFTAVYQRDKAKTIQEDCATIRYTLLRNGRQPQSIEWDDNQIIVKGHLMEDKHVDGSSSMVRDDTAGSSAGS